MPGKDGTGPDGNGPKQQNPGVPGPGSQVPRGRGLGRGPGSQVPRGRGRRNRGQFCPWRNDPQTDGAEAETVEPEGKEADKEVDAEIDADEQT